LKSPKNFCISEHGLIRCLSNDVDAVCSLSEIFVPHITFENLKTMAFRSDFEPVIQFFIQKGKECLRVKNYVGILQTIDGAQIEILPKITQQNEPATARQTLIQLLKHWPDAPFKSLSQASLSHSTGPLYEIFVAVFVAEVQKLLRQGLQKNYEIEEDYQPFVRGKWLLAQQLSQNMAHQTQFLIQHDDFRANIAANRLIKSCIVYLQKISKNSHLQQLRVVFDSIDCSQNLSHDFAKISKKDRRFERYEAALHWVKLLMNHQILTGQNGMVGPSLLFNLERLFENYVARGFKKYLTDSEVYVQDKSLYLISDHAGKKQFGLRPDLVIKRGLKTYILDTKWKFIDIAKSSENYGISQTDLYQMFTYGQKYQADALVLIYPAHAHFSTPLPVFYYDNELPLRILPFDISQPLSSQIAIFEAYL
jgi:5-methylcytosine-specific restriction enzyme subunit McrC